MASVHVRGKQRYDVSTCYQWLPRCVGTVDEFPSLYVLNFIQVKMNNFIIIRISLSVLIVKSVRKIRLERILFVLYLHLGV